MKELRLSTHHSIFIFGPANHWFLDEGCFHWVDLDTVQSSHGGFGLCSVYINWTRKWCGTEVCVLTCYCVYKPNFSTDIKSWTNIDMSIFTECVSVRAHCVWALMRLFHVSNKGRPPTVPNTSTLIHCYVMSPICTLFLSHAQTHTHLWASK